ncbi:MAG TPA: DUF4276 family protein [Methanocorpusculum sp.]|nr:DUF4276 family protein [Methanocorpusculum sp.]HJJ50035.1 DUF4276 family protein [Methanocorpusculum sp.]HKL97963.1 DUF4276 family protein [Methanocorpusculum sp.]
MVILLISCEGYTEEVFIKRLMASEMAHLGITIIPIIVMTSKTKSGYVCRGGCSSYDKIKRDVLNLCKRKSAYVTTMYDFYKFPEIPGFRESYDLATPLERVTELEEAFSRDIDRENFHPYIQLHEFESLLFSDPSAFSVCGMTKTQVRKLAAVRNDFPPEEINGGEMTAPSKRIIRVNPGYQKPTDGLTVAREIGLERMSVECPHFGEWVAWIKTLPEQAKKAGSER